MPIDRSVRPPRGWDVTIGTWDTHMTRSDSQFGSGRYALQFETSLTGELSSPFFPAGAPEAFFVTLNLADYALYEATFDIRVIEYQADRTTVVATTTIFNGTIPSNGNWWPYEGGMVRVTSANTRWARIAVKCSAYVNGPAQVDFVRHEPVPLHLIKEGPNLTTAIPTNTWTEINSLISNTEASVGVLDGGASGFAFMRGGLLDFQIRTELDDMATGKTFYLRLLKNGTQVRRNFQAATTGINASVVLCVTLDTAANDVFIPQVYHDHGSDRDLIRNDSFLSVTRRHQ